MFLLKKERIVIFQKKPKNKKKACNHGQKSRLIQTNTQTQKKDKNIETEQNCYPNIPSWLCFFINRRM